MEYLLLGGLGLSSTRGKRLDWVCFPNVELAAEVLQELALLARRSSCPLESEQRTSWYVSIYIYMYVCKYIYIYAQTMYRCIHTYT